MALIRRFLPGRRALSWLVVLALLGATAVAARQVWEAERDDAEAANRAVARQAALSARQTVGLLASGVRGGEVVVGADGDLIEERFARFARDVLRRTPFPTLGFAPLITADRRREFEAQTGRKIVALDGTRFRVAPRRRLHLPFEKVEPHRRLRREIVGFDLLSERNRRLAVMRARDSGHARLVAPVIEANTGRVGTLLLSPIYRSGAPNQTRADRRDALVGFFAAGIGGERLAAAIVARLGLDDLRIADEGQLLAGPGSPPGDWVDASAPLPGRRWTVSVPPIAAADPKPAIVFGVGGGLLALVAAAIFWTAGRRERDLRARREAAELQAARESLLTRIAESMERETGVDERLARLAWEMVPATGDTCAVYAAAASGEVRRAGVAAIDPEVDEIMRRMGPIPSTSPVRAAIATHQPVIHTRVSDPAAEDRPPPAEGRDADAEEQWPPRTEAELARHIRSSMIVPLLARGRVLGAIALGVLHDGDRPPYTRDDLVFATEVATYAAVALDNARLYEHERDIADVLQRALLPRSLPDVTGARVAARHRPGTAGTEVGGDFYDLFETVRGWMAVVGDVCGKGPEAAALTALVRHTLRATADEGPEAAVARVHDAIRNSGEHTYCTLCCAELRVEPAGGLSARIATAGHPEPRVVGRDGRVHRLSVTGPLVGAFDSPRFGSEVRHLAPGELLFICSDGVPEARRNGEVFGDGRLEHVLADAAGLDPDDVLDRLEREVLRFVSERPSDDVALFALRVD